MSFLNAIFFAGIAAISVPVLIHLIQREKKEVVHFPSLMFLRRIPYQSVQRRRLHNLLLLLLRALSILLVVLAFTRPFFPSGSGTPVLASTAGAREVVILLDTSASMAYGDHWQKAKAEAKKIVNGLSGEDRGTLVLFARNAEENVRSTGDRPRLNTSIDAAEVGSDSTRYGPALRLAQSRLMQSTLPRKEAFLITDLQKSGWERHEEAHLPEGAVLTPISVATPNTSNISIPSVSFVRAAFSGQERVTATAAVMNRSAQPVNNLAVTIEIDGHETGRQTVSLAAGTSTAVTFPQFTLAEGNVKGVVKAGTDLLPKDNAFYFVLSPARPVSVLVVEPDGASANDSLYLKTALDVSDRVKFQTDVVAVSKVSASSLDKRSVVVLNNAPYLSPTFAAALQKFVEQGGGLFIAIAENSPFPGAESPLLPGKLTGTVDRGDGVSGTLGFLDFSHPAFEQFKTKANFSSARFYKYRTVTPLPTDRVLARFDDGATAMAERTVGVGHVIVWTSDLATGWNFFPTAAIFPGFIEQIAQYLAHFDQPAAWETVGRVVDLALPLAAGGKATPGGPAPSGLVVAPSGQRLPIGGRDHAASTELNEQGFYTVRPEGQGDVRPVTIAANLDPTESDLSAMDGQELVGGLTGRASAAVGVAATAEITPQEVERQQAVWWFLLVLGVAAFIAEAILSNRLSRRRTYLAPAAPQV